MIMMIKIVDFLDNISHIHLCVNDDLYILQEESTAVLLSIVLFSWQPKGNKNTEARYALRKGKQ